MQEKPGMQADGPMNLSSKPFGNTICGASSGLIRGKLGAYGENILDLALNMCKTMMDVSGDSAKGFITIAWMGRGTITRHGSAFRLYFHRDTSCWNWTTDAKLQISSDNFMDMAMHCHRLGENNEEDTFR